MSIKIRTTCITYTPPSERTCCGSNDCGAPRVWVQGKRRCREAEVLVVGAKRVDLMCDRERFKDLGRSRKRHKDCSEVLNRATSVAEYQLAEMPLLFYPPDETYVLPGASRIHAHRTDGKFSAVRRLNRRSRFDWIGVVQGIRG